MLFNPNLIFCLAICTGTYASSTSVGELHGLQVRQTKKKVVNDVLCGTTKWTRERIIETLQKAKPVPLGYFGLYPEIYKNEDVDK
ncbi:hypothetical protein G7Y89_g14691 [Cudoniella acicularis]|uniref:Secreted protein n=1 Tax=Cudoniella acicularis TaxID=354080 RepID=A0A8H4QZ14_9HELO|nr:hypothetical protein G7Y89_g14691 [Cudoniella acicularis]